MNFFIKKAAKLSDHELYELIKEKTISDTLMNIESEPLLEAAYRESKEREGNIFQKAVTDASLILSRIQRQNLEQRDLNILRTEFMTDSEMKGIVVKYDDEKQGKDDLGLFGVNRDDLMIYHVTGHSMKDMGINGGDALFVDKAEEPSSSDMVVAKVNGKVFVKKYIKTKEGKWLVSDNRRYKPFKIEEDDEFEVLGVVRKVLRDV